MAKPTLARLVGSIRASVEPTSESTDANLLIRFVEARDEDAFRVLVHRYGKTVLSACRQVLTDPADIDDAFQATFLVLLKKAKSVDGTAPLGGWLFAVAHRVAARSRADTTRRRIREAEAARRQRIATELPDVSWREVAAILHDELNTLPERYHLPLLLCSVQGLTRDEAAEQLGSTIGAVRGWLERGRSLLERRLAKRGIVLSAGLLAVWMGGSRAAGGPSAELIELAMQVAGGHTRSAVALLARGAFPMTTLKQLILPVVLIFGLIGLGIGLGSRSPVATADEKLTPESEKRQTDTKPEPKKPEAKDRTITGKVLDASGKPVQAELHLIWVGGKPESLGKTKDDGTFRVTVPLLEPGAYLVAKADGYGIDFLLPATNTSTEVTFKLPKDQLIRGRVIDTQGKPVAGAVVTPRFLLAFADGTANGFLVEWKSRHPESDVPSGSNNLWLSPDTEFTLPDGQMMLAAKTDSDGKFEIAGFGAERVADLLIHGAGVADTNVYVVNREKFDPNPVNLATADNYDRMIPNRMSRIGQSKRLHGPNPLVIVEQEKVIRGTVKDRDTGKPLADVEVLSIVRMQPQRHWAKTDKDGNFEIRGSRKNELYVLEARGDPDTDYLPCLVEAKDTVGYEPIAVEFRCAKGVVVSRMMTDRVTGKPVTGHVYAVPMRDNEYVKKYPTMLSWPNAATQKVGSAEGAFRIITVPGRVLLMGGPLDDEICYHYKPQQPARNFQSTSTERSPDLAFTLQAVVWVPSRATGARYWRSRSRIQQSCRTSNSNRQRGSRSGW